MLIYLLLHMYLRWCAIIVASLPTSSMKGEPRSFPFGVDRRCVFAPLTLEGSKLISSIEQPVRVGAGTEKLGKIS